MRDNAQTEPRELLNALFRAAVERAAAGPAVLAHLPPKPRGRCVVIGAGKAAAAMAAAVDQAWPDVDLSGVVVTRYGHAIPAGRIRVLEAAHPVADTMSEQAAREAIAAVSGLGEQDLVLALISGGGSALLALPVEGVTLADKQQLTRQLLRSGATISEMNLLRRQLSAVKGGALAALAQPAQVVTLAVSDVPGDNPADIASGPTIASDDTPQQALRILQRYAITPAAAVLRALEQPRRALPPNPRAQHQIIANALSSLEAAATLARACGYAPLILGDALEGESRQLGTVMAGIAKAVKLHGYPLPRPAVLLSGGETTVTVSGPAGSGGRNSEFLLGLACALQGETGIWGIAGDSDGIDGTSEAAGAVVTPDTLSRAQALGMDASDYLARHDSDSFFARLQDLTITGPTLTNVNDIRIILIE